MRKITIGESLLELQSVDSTNTYATTLLHKGDVTEGTVILAGHQTQGRGQGDNRWDSDTGCNLLCSVILKPEFLMAERQFYISMCVSIAIVDYIVSLGKPAHIKWPNDILMNRKKVAGILIENTIMGRNIKNSVVGIGLNVNQKVFPSELPNPTSISLETGCNYTLPVMLCQLMKCLNHTINKLYDEEYMEIRTAYLNNLWLMNEWVQFTDESGNFEGRIADVAVTGELIVLHRGRGMRQYGFKEIIFPGFTSPIP
jgi:BirA family biotin operon repressor/biotin-[acetyl-CoA-carboxylase] ligase